MKIFNFEEEMDIQYKDFYDPNQLFVLVQVSYAIDLDIITNTETTFVVETDYDITTSIIYRLDNLSELDDIPEQILEEFPFTFKIFVYDKKIKVEEKDFIRIRNKGDMCRLFEYETARFIDYGCSNIAKYIASEYFNEDMESSKEKINHVYFDNEKIDITPYL